MVHYKLKKYLEQHTDLAACGHFDFFNRFPELLESKACSIWFTGLSQFGEGSDSNTKILVESLKQNYISDKKNGAMKQYWDNRKLEQEIEKSQKEAVAHTTITVNRTTARVMQSLEKNGGSILEILDADSSNATGAIVDSTSTPMKRKDSPIISGN
ncbi:hypothetical protein BGX27_004268, partial [Mortierella sp. AM989]